MKKAGVLLYILIFIIISYFISNNIKAQNDGFKLYEHSQRIFSIKYPENWEYREVGKETIIFSPSDKEAKENQFSVIYGNLTAAENLTTKEMTGEFEKIFKEHFPGAKEIEEERPVVLGNSRAILYKIILNPEKKENSSEILALISENKGTIFIILAQSSARKFSQYEQIYLKMIKSFRAPVPKIVNTPTPVPTATPTPKAYNPLQSIPEKIEGWQLFSESNNVLSFQYPAEWTIKEVRQEEIYKIHILPEKEKYPHNIVTIIYFKPAFGGEKVVTTESLIVDISSQMEALGYEITEEKEDTFCNIPCGFIKGMLARSDVNIERTAIAFQRGAYIVQIFITQKEETEEDYYNRVEQLLDTFRPFPVDDSVWW